MFKKFTAVIQLMLMLVVVATSQPSLSFCLCAHEFHVGDCPCGKEITDSNDELLTTTTLATCTKGCCAQKAKKTETLATIQSQPCSDCIVNLALDVDDYTIGTVEISKNSGDSHPTPFLASVTNPLITNYTFNTAIYGIRGSPPIFLRDQSIPLFVRHSAYLL